MKFNNATHYKITKLSAHDPIKLSCIDNNYWVIGVLEKEPEVGAVVFMWRLANKNYPDGRMGYFKTSTVKSVNKKDDHWEILTKNSVYKLEKYAAA